MKLATMISALMLATPLFSQTSPLQPITRADLNVTDGNVTTSNGHLRVDVPEMRAVMRVPSAQSVELRFTYLGPTEKASRLADGEVRQQFGLKLNAQDPCNLAYVMWRIAPKPDLVVSIKQNPGMHSSSQCHDGGYVNLKPAKWSRVPELHTGSSHVLRAELNPRDLRIRVDGQQVWEGRIPSEAMSFDGPVGVRSDNVRVEFDVLVPR